MTIRWRKDRVEETPHLVIDWTETGGRPAAGGGEEVRQGYGQELIERALPCALGARTSYELTETGVRCTIALPLAGSRRVDREGEDGRERR